MKDATGADPSLDFVTAITYYEGHYAAIVMKESGEFVRSVCVCVSACLCVCVCVSV